MRASSEPGTATVHTATRQAWPLLRELGCARWRSLLAVLGMVMCGRAAALVLPASTKYLVDDVMLRGNVQLLGPVVLAIIAATLLHSALTFAAMNVLSAAGIELVGRLRCRVQSHIVRLPLVYYDRRQSGALVRRVIDDATGARTLFGVELIQFVGAGLTGVYALAFLLTISVKLTVLAVIGVVLPIALSARQLRQVQTLSLELLQRWAAVGGRLQETIAGVRIVKAYHSERREAAAFADAVQQVGDVAARAARIRSALTVASGATTGLAAAAILYVAAVDILAGALSIGSMVTFLAFLSLLTIPAQQLPSVGATLAEAMAGLVRVQEVLREAPEDENPRRVRDVGPLGGAISFEGVSFSYGDRPVLRDIAFEARPGTLTAIVGPSGSGKSTLVSLIASFYEPTAGTIRVDGLDLTTLRLEAYRRQLGIVLQDNVLFSGTLWDNVAFARPDASETEIAGACRAAHVDEFAVALPRGFHAVVGERGLTLSVGQRQRVAIARAILANPRILILDEATSNLDVEAEAVVHGQIWPLCAGRTTFVVTHRLATVRRADQILVLQDGRIAERGTHDALMAQQGRYHDLFSLQSTVTHVPAFEDAFHMRFQG